MYIVVDPYRKIYTYEDIDTLYEETVKKYDLVDASYDRPSLVELNLWFIRYEGKQMTLYTGDDKTPGWEFMLVLDNRTIRL